MQTSQFSALDVNNFYVGDDNATALNGWGTGTIRTFYDYYWCPIHYSIPEPSKIDKAFAVVKKLIDEELIEKKRLTVGKFIELVDKIKEVL